MADMYEVHLDLLATLRTAAVAAGLSADHVIDGKLPDGDAVPLLPGPNGVVAPHMCLWMGEPDEHPEGRAIDGAVNALGLLVFTVMYVGASPLMTTRVRDIGNRALIAHELPDGGEVSTAGGGQAENPVVSMIRPQRYMREVGYFASVGATGALV